MLSLEDLEAYTKGKDFKLSEYAAKIYECMKIRNGCCPCRVEDVLCPCPHHLYELEREGKCHCNLFVKV